MSRSPIVLALAAFAVALLAVPAALASGGSDRSIRVQGTCTQQSTSKLKLSSDDRGIEVEFEVDQNVNGDTWSVRLRDNGMTFFKGTRVTQPPSGSFTVQRRTDNLDGTDQITARAANQSTGEVCRASLKI